MSYRFRTMVFNTKLPRPEKWVLFNMAVFVDDQGQGFFGSNQYLAYLSDYSVQRIKEIVTSLEEKGLIVAYGNHPWLDTNIWDINPGKLISLPHMDLRAMQASVIGDIHDSARRQTTQR